MFFNHYLLPESLRYIVQINYSRQHRILSLRALSSARPRSLPQSPHFRFVQQSIRIRVAALSTITNAITKDHRELEQYYNEVIGSNDHDHQERYGNQFVWELARHSVGEELVVYPALEKHLGSQGHQMAEHDREEHHKASFFSVLINVKRICLIFKRSRSYSNNSRT